MELLEESMAGTLYQEHEKFFLLNRGLFVVYYLRMGISTRRKEVSDWMSSQLKPDSANDLTITLEVVPESLQDVDPAMVDAVGRDTVDSVRNDGYGIAPVYTGQRGGFVIDVLIPALTTLWTQRDVILADGSALVTIFTPVVLIAQHLHEAHKRRKGNNAMQQIPIKITA